MGTPARTARVFPYQTGGKHRKLAAMRLVIFLLAALHVLGLGLFAADLALLAPGAPERARAEGLLLLGLAIALPLIAPAVLLALRNRALPFALTLSLVLPVSVSFVVLLL